MLIIRYIIFIYVCYVILTIQISNPFVLIIEDFSYIKMVRLHYDLFYRDNL